MRKSLASATLTAALLTGGQGAHACGDKLLALGKGVLFQRAYVAMRPAEILIYTGRDPKGKDLVSPDLRAMLQRAGHKLEVAADSAQAREMLLAGRFDLVLTDYSGASALEAVSKTASSKPIMLPLMYKPAKPEYQTAAKRYGLVLKAPAIPAEILMGIEQAMKTRAQSVKS